MIKPHILSNKNPVIKYIIGMIIIPCVLASFVPAFGLRVNASRGIVEYMPITIAGITDNTTKNEAGEVTQVAAIDLSYTNNTYISLSDMERLLAETDAAFSLNIQKGEIKIKSQSPNLDDLKDDESDKNNDDESDDENSDLSDDVQKVSCNLKANSLTVDDEKRLYYSILVDYDDDGDTDCFMTPYDMAMLLDIYIELQGDDHLYVDPGKKFSVDPGVLEADGYFQGVNALVCGNASTGEIYYSYNCDLAYPIASTTKLMTYLLTKEFLANTGGSESDMVTISKNAELLSTGDDGVVPMKAGMQVSVHELMQAMLIPSSNASALALAEYVAGTEDAFVELMNEQARKLDMTTAVFYNCNGLPVYTDSTYAAKKQNRMSATDMFRLSSYILALFPDITEITQTQKTTLDILGKEIDNTNAVIYNISEATGLKTGTTTKAGACLVTSIRMDNGSDSEDLCVVLLGAETGSERSRVSETMARYSMAVWNNEAKAYGDNTSATDSETPVTAEGFVSVITREARSRYMTALQDNN